MLTPLASMVESGICDGRADQQLWPDEIGTAAKPDVVVWQRQVEDAQIDAMRRWRTLLPDTLFIFELDDYLGEIPPASFHASFMPPDITQRVTDAIAICDRVTTTTEPMAVWLRSLGARDVRVIPNGLPQARIRERSPRVTGKLRVGWSGGMSHAGDLALICPAMEAIGDEVTWVFLGMQPENCPVRVEYHDGVSVMAYLDATANLDLDLVLAPLEDNPFNLCKSNLRLVEAGTMGSSVIAQNLPPYHLDKPPVFAYADTPNDWETAIRAYIKTKPSARKQNADAMRAWVGRYYTLERLLPQRVKAWLPDDLKWKPSPAKASSDRPVLSMTDGSVAVEQMPWLHSNFTLINEGLEAACRKAITYGTDVLWMRPVSTITERGWKTLRAIAAQAPEIASVVPLASDGINGFPVADRWSPVPVPTISLMDDLARKQLSGRRFIVSAPSGPVILLTRHALSMLGVPDVAGCDNNEEQAILEWGMRAASRQWKHMQAGDVFAASLTPPAQPTQQSVLRLQARGMANWLQVPSEGPSTDERENLELALLREQWGGPRPGSGGFGNDYELWSALRRVQKPTSASFAAMTTISVRSFGEELDDNEWTVFIDDAVTLQEGARQRFTSMARDLSDDVQIIYADHESLVGDKPLPEFKPEFDLELLLAQDYVTQICAVRTSLFGDEPPTDRSELFKLVLQTALRRGAKSFRHIPEVLATVKIDMDPGRQALDTLSRQVAIQDLMGDAVKVTANKGLMGCLSVVRDWKTTYPGAPIVSIIVPTLGSSRLIQPCIGTILQHTDYINYEILIVQNGDRKKPELLPATEQHPKVRVVYYDGTTTDGFNWSKINNWAIRTQARGEYIVTLNDDICVSTKWWLDNMMGQAVQPDVGAVGARLLHPMGVVQHVGVICHSGVAGHLHKGLPNGQGGHLGRAVLTHEMSAVTGACMAFSRANYERVGGFDESLSHNYGDTLFCLKLRELGLRNVVEMSAELIHPEGASRESGFTPFGAQKLMDEGKVIAKACMGADPYWSPNLAVGFRAGRIGHPGLERGSSRLAGFHTEA